MSCPTGYIRYVKYYLENDEDKLKKSVMEVVNSSIYIDDKPVKGGVYDLRMGTVDRNDCETCGLDMDNCKGHFGHHHLHYPLKEPLTILDALEWANLVCHRCGYPYITIEQLESLQGNKFDAFKKIIKENKNNTCEICAEEDITSTRINVVKDNNSTVFINEKNKEVITNEELETIFNKIPKIILTKYLDIDISYHPKNFITRVLLISPNNVRPEARKIGGSGSTSDDITRLYQILITNNKKIEQLLKNQDTEEEVKQLKDLIEIQDNAYFHLMLGDPKASDASFNKIKNSSGTILYSYSKGLKSKEGHIKYSSQGKKVGYVGRSVIVGESNIPMGVVVISFETAMTLVRKVTVTPYNINEILLYVENGSRRYPGCTEVHRNGRVFSIDKFKVKGKIQIGDKVLRHLIDGDFVIFNRMPSLSWRSLGAHQVMVRENEWTYRFNENVCQYYNADFDGDEMNIYTLSSTPALIELKHLINVENWGIDFQSGICTIGLKEDAILGIALLTFHGVELSLKDVYYLFSQTILRPKIRDFKRHKNYKSHVSPGKYSGRDIISITLQTMGIDINFKGKSKCFNKKHQEHFKFDDSDEEIIIENGHMLSGILDAAGTKQGSSWTPFHLAFNKYGSSVANSLSFNLQQIGLLYLTMNNQSFGLDDV